VITTGNSVRVFIAVDIPLVAKDILAQTVRQLQMNIPTGVRWVDPGGIHLTLKFLGNVDSSRVNDILAAMKHVAEEFQGRKFQLALSGLGLFPNTKQPRVLWAGTDGDLDTLRSLQALVDEVVSRLGFSRENRPFRPHLTIGRVREGAPPEARRFIGEVVIKTPLPSVDAWEVDAIHLVRSTLTPDGAIYTSLGCVPL
jgi:2'-5' RNA ligase